MTNSDSFTTYETVILDVLSDGDRHRTHEIGARIDPELPLENDLVRQAVGRLRKKLLLRNETIVCEYFQKKFYYRHVRLVTSGD